MTKTSISIAIAVTLALPSLSFALDAELSLFESANVIHKFIAGTTKRNYTEFRLTRISLEFIEDSTKSGRAYVYFFNRPEAGTGGGLTIYHFTDGTIIEGTFGP